MGTAAIIEISGRGIVVRGNDIDTDRIIPAQFMKAITFSGLEQYLFYNDRKLSERVHPFDDPRFQGARILVVNKNFGCGSSREHAPQALKRWGIAAIVGESFAEIFFGNCLAIGVPCVTASEDAISRVMGWIENHPREKLILSVMDQLLSFGQSQIPVSLPESARVRFLTGTWDALGVLLESVQEVDRVTKNLPYLRWSRATLSDKETKETS